MNTAPRVLSRLAATILGTQENGGEPEVQSVGEMLTSESVHMRRPKPQYPSSCDLEKKKSDTSFDG